MNANTLFKHTIHTIEVNLLPLMDGSCSCPLWFSPKRQWPGVLRTNWTTVNIGMWSMQLICVSYTESTAQRLLIHPRILHQEWLPSRSKTQRPVSQTGHRPRYTKWVGSTKTSIHVQCQGSGTNCMFLFLYQWWTSSSAGSFWRRRTCWRERQRLILRWLRFVC